MCLQNLVVENGVDFVISLQYPRGRISFFVFEGRELHDFHLFLEFLKLLRKRELFLGLEHNVFDFRKVLKEVVPAFIGTKSFDGDLLAL